VQEVYIRAFRAWTNYRKDANAKTWLMSIAQNYIFDLVRKKRTERIFLTSNGSPEENTESCHIGNFTMKETEQCLGWSENKARTTTPLGIDQVEQNTWG
jgi:RNA polymerase sigma-70 factor, ECF subfamily